MRNAAAARPKPEQGFHLEIYGGKWESAMTTHSRRETARRRRHRTGQRHGKAFASVYTLPTQAPPHRRPHNSPRRLTSSQPSMQSTITPTPLLHRPEPAKAAKGPVIEARLATVATSARSPAAPPPRRRWAQLEAATAPTRASRNRLRRSTSTASRTSTRRRQPPRCRPRLYVPHRPPAVGSISTLLSRPPRSTCRTRFHATEPASTLHRPHRPPRHAAGRISTGCTGLHTAGLASTILHAPPPPEPACISAALASIPATCRRHCIPAATRLLSRTWLQIRRWPTRIR